jgi:hypothetical protein
MEGCSGTHEILRFSKNVIECMSAKNDKYTCPFSVEECPYMHHQVNAGD